MKRTVMLIILLLGVYSTTFADAMPYSDSIVLKVKSKHFMLIHYHNWKESTRQSRYKMISTDQNPFTNANDYAYIECVELKTGKIIFKRPSTAFTKLAISKDEKYIVGISNIMLDNPFQMVLYSISGEILKKRHIASEEAKLTSLKMQDFKRVFFAQYEYLDSIGRIFSDSGYYYVDFISMNMPLKLAEAWKYLYENLSYNHLSTYFSESVTNWINWYYEANPDIVFQYDSKKLESIGLLDPKLNRIDIKIDESPRILW